MPTLLLLFLLFGEIPLSQMAVVHWDMRDGLPQNSATQIVQGDEGAIWFASEEGLVRFDGLDFHTFDKNNTPEMLHNNVIQLLKLGPELILVMVNGDILKKDQSGFQSLPRVGSGPGPTLALDQNGSLLAVHTSGLYQFQNHNWQLLKRHSFSPENSLLCRDKTVLVGGEKLFSFQRDNKEIALIPWPNRATRETRNLKIMNQYIWVSTTRGLFVLGKDGGELEIVPGTEKLDVHDVIWFLNEYWVASDSGIYRMGKDLILKTEDSREIQFPITFLVDREENLWIGSAGHGLFMIRDSPLKPFYTDQGLPNEAISLITTLSDGNVIAFSRKGRPYLLQGNRFIRQPQLPNFLPQDVYACHVEGPTIWLGTQFGLYKYHGEAGRLIQIDGREIGTIRAIARQANNLILGGETTGIYIQKPNGWTHLGISEGLPSEEIRDILVTDIGFWVATYGGLAKIENGVVVKVLTERNGLGNRFCRKLYFDQEYLWIGHYGGGLSLVHDNQILTLSQEDGFVSDVVYNMIEDRFGFIWINGNKGIHRFSKKELLAHLKDANHQVNYDSFGFGDGLITLESSGFNPSSTLDSEGQIWFAMHAGVVRIDPEIQRESLPPKVSIAHESDQQLINNAFPASLKRVTFQLSGISFVDPERVQFRTKLEGYETEWQPTKQRNVSFTNLPAGNYKFHVQARLHNSLWEEAHATMSFKILAAWYARPWVRISFGSLFLLMVWFVYWIRTQHIHKQKSLLESAVQSRTSELISIQKEMIQLAHRAGMSELAQEILHTIGNCLNTIEVGAEGIQETLSTPSNTVLNKVFDELELKFPEQAELISKYQKYLILFFENKDARLLEDATDLHQASVMAMKLIRGQEKTARATWQFERLRLRHLVEESLDLHQSELKALNIEMNLKVPDLEIQTDHYRLVNVLSNLIKNSCEALEQVEYPRKLHIQGHQGDDQVQILIEDNGIGLKAADKESLFSLGFSTKADGAGLGLHYCANVIHSMGGHIEASSDGHMKGMEILICLPLNI